MTFSAVGMIGKLLATDRPLCIGAARADLNPAVRLRFGRDVVGRKQLDKTEELPGNDRDRSGGFHRAGDLDGCCLAKVAGLNVGI